MENCVVEMTDDNPWNPMEVNIAYIGSVLPSMEIATYQQVCTLDGIIKKACDVHNCKCGYQDSDLLVFDSASLVHRMVRAVNVATGASGKCFVHRSKRQKTSKSN
jgi:hypothetical protein